MRYLNQFHTGAKVMTDGRAKVAKRTRKKPIVVAEATKSVPATAAATKKTARQRRTVSDASLDVAWSPANSHEGHRKSNGASAAAKVIGEVILPARKAATSKPEGAVKPTSLAAKSSSRSLLNRPTKSVSAGSPQRPTIAPRNAALPQGMKCETGSMQKQRSMSSSAMPDRNNQNGRRGPGGPFH